ncbi:hypothetical protein EHQ13_16450 [Leptospira gomenensis]|uniref:Tetratricopeptide repeat protein n=1 Tax=Leptospira gomenensis TaxID=2484974 RepID=A0A5F1YIP8_9LEPT|nr:hypothetical protein [Leptospira gomenensis]TGK38491.1 hypothetical protein EHQ17_02335 [Leptospira gomenensis]TGK42606.1 hypothetical protein EHQ07_14430 [Leptospira gomenensis]TGK55854.1 hypothetical protein EHQ13_16450 [Leptospira gomenensis]
MKKKINITIIYFIILFVGCSIDSRKLYLFPPTPEGELLKRVFLPFYDKSVIIRTKVADIEKKALYYSFTQYEDDYKLTDECEGKENICIVIDFNHINECKNKQGLLSVTAKILFESLKTSEIKKAPLQFSKRLTIYSDDCQISPQTIRAAHYTMIELIRHTIMPRKFTLWGSSEKYSNFKSSNKELQEMYTDFIEEAGGDYPSYSRARKILDEAEIRFPKDAWLIRNIGTTILFTGDWQRACEYYKRSASLENTEGIEKWLNACDRFDFSSVL